jgi:hypothetical protein
MGEFWCFFILTSWWELFLTSDFLNEFYSMLGIVLETWERRYIKQNSAPDKGKIQGHVNYVVLDMNSLLYKLVIL